MANTENSTDCRFGSFRIDLATWDIFGKDGRRIEGVGVIPVRILKAVIDGKGEIVRGSDEALLQILANYTNNANERQIAFMKYMSTLRTRMGSTEFDALFPNVRKSRDAEANIGGYKFVGELLRSGEASSDGSGRADGAGAPPPNEGAGDSVEGIEDAREARNTVSHWIPEGLEWPEFIAQVSSPDPTALQFAESFNVNDGRTIGCVVDVFRHPFLESSRSLNETGWSADQITLVHDGYLNATALISDPRVTTAFAESEEKRKEAGKASALQPPSNFKYAIAGTSTPFHDVTDLTIALKQTDYFTVLRSRPAIDKYPDLRIEFGHIDPSQNRIPQAAAIQFCAIFGREVLAIQRDKNTFPWPGKWSFSGEEQFDKNDLHWNEQDRMKYAMLRTAQEEIFPLAKISDKEELMKAMKMVEPYIQNMRVWGLFLEEPTATFSVFCVYTFEFGSKDYANLVRGMNRRGLGQTSREGKYHAVKLDDLPMLLDGTKIPATEMFGSDSVLIGPDELHPTSRYRLVHLLNVLHNQHWDW